jgi:CHASE2 domain
VPVKHPQYEKILHDYLLRAPKVVLGARLGFPEDPDVIPPMQPVPILRKVHGDRNSVLEFTVVEHQAKEEYRLSPTLGFTNLPISKGVVRRAPLVFRYRGEIVPSFVLQAMMLWLELTPDEIEVDIGSHIALANKVSIPIDALGMMLVDFKSPMERVGYDDLLLAAEQIQIKRKPVVAAELFKDRIVLLARTDSASRRLQFPTGRMGSSGDLFASAIATIQNRAFIHRVPGWADGLLLAGALALCPLFVRISRQGVIFLSTLLIVGYVLGAMTLFGARLIWMPLLLPAGLLVFMTIYSLFVPRTGGGIASAAGSPEREHAAPFK